MTYFISANNIAHPLIYEITESGDTYISVPCMDINQTGVFREKLSPGVRMCEMCENLKYSKTWVPYEVPKTPDIIGKIISLIRFSPLSHRTPAFPGWFGQESIIPTYLNVPEWYSLSVTFSAYEDIDGAYVYFNEAEYIGTVAKKLNYLITVNRHRKNTKPEVVYSLRIDIPVASNLRMPVEEAESLTTLGILSCRKFRCEVYHNPEWEPIAHILWERNVQREDLL